MAAGAMASRPLRTPACRDVLRAGLSSLPLRCPRARRCSTARVHRPSCRRGRWARHPGDCDGTPRARCAGQPEPGHDLRHLGVVPELVRAVPDIKATAEFAGEADALLETADVRFAARQELIRLHPPGADDDAALLDQPSQPPLVFRPQFEVVRDHNRLAIKVEAAVLRVPLHVFDELVDHLYEPPAEQLEWLIPLAVPVGVRHDVDDTIHGAMVRQRCYTGVSASRLSQTALSGGKVRTTEHGRPLYGSSRAMTTPLLPELLPP